MVNELSDLRLYGADDPLWYEGEAMLGRLAARWRSTNQSGETDQSKRLLVAYHEMVHFLWTKGWRGNHLLPEEELPNELMPAYFVEHWKSR